MNRNILLAEITEGSKKTEIMGFMTWWSLRSISLTREEFQILLEKVGLNKNYAVEHNYLSAFKRALKSLEEKRIIRIVSDNAFAIRCQFTAEKKVEDQQNGDHLNYDRETIIEVNKEIYRKEKEFAKAVTEGEPKIVEGLVKLFNWEKNRYNSHDMNRYIQNILRKEADIISLRDQGCLYFVPAGYQTTLDAVKTLVNSLPGDGVFTTMPVPNLAGAKSLVKAAVVDDVESAMKTIEGEIEQATKDGREISEIWSRTRIQRLKKVKQRLVSYEGLLEDKSLVESAVNLEKEIMKFRVIEID